MGPPLSLAYRALAGAGTGGLRALGMRALAATHPCVAGRQRGAGAGGGSSKATVGWSAAASGDGSRAERDDEAIGVRARWRVRRGLARARRGQGVVTSVQGLLGATERDRARAEQEQDDKEREAGG